MDSREKPGLARPGEPLSGEKYSPKVSPFAACSSSLAGGGGLRHCCPGAGACGFWRKGGGRKPGARKPVWVGALPGPW